MNTLDLQMLGVEEMDEKEMRDVEGGAWAIILACVIFAAGVYVGYRQEDAAN